MIKSTLSGETLAVLPKVFIGKIFLKKSQEQKLNVLYQLTELLCTCFHMTFEIRLVEACKRKIHSVLDFVNCKCISSMEIIFLFGLFTSNCC